MLSLAAEVEAAVGSKPPSMLTNRSQPLIESKTGPALLTIFPKLMASDLLNHVGDRDGSSCAVPRLRRLRLRHRKIEQRQSCHRDGREDEEPHVIIPDS